ncbi:hypothetical protein H8D04_01085 [bacterium]|nr:hypothetical protein [bacterium]
MILELLFCLMIIVYWFSEGVTEGYTWAKPKRRNENKLIHPNKKSNGIMDYHGWRIFENVGIWGTVLIAFFLETTIQNFFLLGIGSWLIGSSLYEFALNHICYDKIWKPANYRWHILGYDIPWFGGKKVLVLPIVGLLVLVYGIFRIT